MSTAWKRTAIPEDPGWEEYTKPVKTRTKGEGRVNVWLRMDGHWYVSFNGKNIRAMTGLQANNAKAAKAEGYWWARRL